MANTRPSLGFAITGFGELAEHVHAPVLSRLPGVELVAIAEPSPARREQARRRLPRAQLYSNQDEMLSRSEIQAVVISAPPELHVALALAAMKSEKHVYLEKPLSESLAGAALLLETWRSAHTVGMVGFNYRFNGLVQSARAQLRAGRIGQVRAIRTVFSIAAGAMPEWKASRRRGGGVLLDLASHHVDLVRFLMGAEIAEVSARIWSQRTEEDCAILHLSLENGVLVQSLFSLCAVEEDVVEIYGECGKLTLDRYCLEKVVFTAIRHSASRIQRIGNQLSGFVPSRALWEKLRAPLHEPSYLAAMMQFVEAIEGRAAPDLPSIGDGYRCQAVLEAAEESSRTGRLISIRDAR